MATRSVIAYKNEAGETRGTYVHWSGYPEHILPNTAERFTEIGYDGFRAWIEAGIAGGGYSSVTDDEPYNDNDGVECNMAIDSQAYGYMLEADGVVNVF